jgi:hypothetical protein
MIFEVRVRGMPHIRATAARPATYQRRTSPSMYVEGEGEVSGLPGCPILLLSLGFGH